MDANMDEANKMLENNPRALHSVTRKQSTLTSKSHSADATAIKISISKQTNLA